MSYYDNLGYKRKRDDDYDDYYSSSSSALKKFKYISRADIESFTRTITDLNDYVRKLSSMVNKNAILRVKENEASKKSEIYINSNPIKIVRRIKETLNRDPQQDICAVNGNFNCIYPGALIYADYHLAECNPNPIEGLPRNPIQIYLRLNGETNSGHTVKEPNNGNISSEISKMVQEWAKEKKKACCQIQYKEINVSSSKQLDAEIGISNASNIFSINVSACEEGKQEMTVVFIKQIYYSAFIAPMNAKKLFTTETTVKDLSKVLNDEHPLAALVTQVDYGRIIMLKNESKKKSGEYKGSAKFSCFSLQTKAEMKRKINSEYSTYSVFVYGGSGQSAQKLMACDIEKANEYISEDVIFDGSQGALPISFKTNYIDDLSNALINYGNEYFRTVTEERENIKVCIKNKGAFSCLKQKLWGRKIIGITDDGKYQFGKWEVVINDSSKKVEKYISGQFAEFGFSFDIKWGTDWPYTDVFWRADEKDIPKIIDITISGGCRTANIEIKVNNISKAVRKNCSKHSNEKDFNNDERN